MIEHFWAIPPVGGGPLVPSCFSLNSEPDWVPLHSITCHLPAVCSFAGRIDPLSLTLPPGSRERRDPIVIPLESQFLQVFMELFHRTPLVA